MDKRNWLKEKLYTQRNALRVVVIILALISAVIAMMIDQREVMESDYEIKVISSDSLLITTSSSVFAPSQTNIIEAALVKIKEEHDTVEVIPIGIDTCFGLRTKNSIVVISPKES